VMEETESRWATECVFSHIMTSRNTGPSRTARKLAAWQHNVFPLPVDKYSISSILISEQTE